MNVVIVESPAKAKTINKYLGPGYQVLASYGHVRDLPAKDGSVRPDDDFAMDWEVDGKSGKRLSDIADAVKGADRLILATDPDREGEAISWHVLEVLRDKKRAEATSRSSASSSTPSPRTPCSRRCAIRAQIDDAAGRRLSRPPRARLSRRLHAVAGAVAQAARRALGRPRAVGGAAPRLRPRERDRELQAAGILVGRGHARDARRRPLHRPRSSASTARSSAGSTSPTRRPPARIEAALQLRRLPRRLGRGEAGHGATRRRPSPPRPCSRRPRASSASPPRAPCRSPSASTRTGYITYMRTDGVDIAPEALTADARAVDRQRASATATCRSSRATTRPRPRTRRRRTRRSARPTCRGRPTSLGGSLDADQARLYELIWKRTIASQMASAELERTTVDIDAGARRADGRRSAPPARSIRFDGFLAALPGGPRRRTVPEDEDDETAACRRWRRATRSASAASPPTSTSPSRRRATPRRR